MLESIIKQESIREKLENEMIKRLSQAIRRFFTVDTTGMKEAFVRAFTHH